MKVKGEQKMGTKGIKAKEIKDNLAIILVLIAAFISFLFDPFINNVFHDYQNSVINTILRFFTHSVTIFLLMVFIPSILLYIKKKKEHIIMLWTSFFISAVLSFIIKIIVLRPRPQGIITFPTTFFNVFSFPSTHTTMAFSAVPFLLLFFKKYRYLIFSYCSLVGLSRLYFKVHFLSDVIFGALIGYLIGTFILHFKGLYKSFKIKEHDKLELRRHIIHILLGFILAALLYFDKLNVLYLSVFLIMMTLLFILSKKYYVPIISWILYKFERKHHLKKIPGQGFIFYLLGSTIVIYFFPKDIAIASILILALADSVSHMIGHYGKMKHPFSNTKYYEGFIAGTIVGFFSASIFVSALEAFFASLSAMLIEGFDIKIGNRKVDDNLLIPVIAAIVILGLRIIF